VATESYSKTSNHLNPRALSDNCSALTARLCGMPWSPVPLTDQGQKEEERGEGKMGEIKERSWSARLEQSAETARYRSEVLGDAQEDRR